MTTIASQITSLTIVYSIVYSDADQSKHQSSASLAFVWGIHRGPVNSPHRWPVTRKMFPFDDVIMEKSQYINANVVSNLYLQTYWPSHLHVYQLSFCITICYNIHWHKHIWHVGSLYSNKVHRNSRYDPGIQASYHAIEYVVLVRF